MSIAFSIVGWASMLLLGISEATGSGTPDLHAKIAALAAFWMAAAAYYRKSA